MLYRTIEGSSSSSEPQNDCVVNTSSENAFGKYDTHDCQKLISRRLFPKKGSALEELRRVGLGFDRESFKVGCKIGSSTLPLISLKVSQTLALLPAKTRFNSSSASSKINTSPMSLTSLLTTNEEETAEHSSHDEQHNIICTAEEGPFDRYESLPSTEGDDTQETLAVSALTLDLLSEQKQVLVSENTRIKLKPLQAELDEVCRDIGTKLRRKAELETLIQSMYFFADSFLANDADVQTGQIEFNHDPDFQLTSPSLSTTAQEANEISPKPISELVDGFDDYFIQNGEVESPSQTPSKRVRWSHGGRTYRNMEEDLGRSALYPRTQQRSRQSSERSVEALRGVFEEMRRERGEKRGSPIYDDVLWSSLSLSQV